MEPFNTCDEAENLDPVETSYVSPDWRSKVGEYLLRTLVVAAGVAVGMVLAFIIGLFTGWIAITC
jgi:hypothetical protein